MAEASTIEWTDATWNPITGCAVVSPGCTNCYAMGLAGTRLRNLPSRIGLTVDTKAGPVWNGQVRFNEEWLTQPLRWGRPRKIFVCAHGDLFAEGVPDAWIDRVFAVMALAPQHTFQVLTKRSARMRAYMAGCENPPADLPLREAWVTQWHRRDGVAAAMEDIGRKHPAALGRVKRLPLPNVWLGVSAEDQRRADERVPDLLATPAAVRFVSAEPLLGPIDFHDIPWPAERPRFPQTDDLSDGRSALYPVEGARLDWIIVGGESGPKARAMHQGWARQIRDACAAAGVAFHFKQWGAWAPGALNGDWLILDAYGGLDLPDDRWPDEAAGEVAVTRVGKKAAGRILDGVEHNGMPEVRS